MRLALLLVLFSLLSSGAFAQPLQTGTILPTGMRVTPTAARGAQFQPLKPHLAALPDFLASDAVAMALSPDHSTLLILTSGFNRANGPDGKRDQASSGEYVFIFDVTGDAPVQRQVVGLPNSFQGLAWAPDGTRFFASGGPDDNVASFHWTDHRFEAETPIPLGHKQGNGIAVKPVAAGLAVSPDGTRLLIANYMNDSVSLIDLASRKVIAEQDLRPGRIDKRDSGRPGGTYPWTVAFTAPDRAYVSVQRDREVLALQVGPATLSVAARIRTRGQPNALLASRDGKRLYAALDNSDSVVAIDTERNTILADIAATAPAALLPNPEGLRGANPNFLAFSPDEHHLFVTLGGLNAVSVIQLEGDVLPELKPARILDEDGDEEIDAPMQPSRVIGLIPTGWYPNAVVSAADGSRLYVVNGKAPPGANPDACRSTNTKCGASNEYVLQLEHAGFLSMPMPTPGELGRLSRQVARNDNFPGFGKASDHDAMMSALRSRIRHVIYIIKENRTYDQVLGDLEVGNGDPRLALFPEALGPNHHALARNFVTLDNFYDSGAVSATGWNWSTAARATDMTEKTVPLAYAGRGFGYDWEGQNRNVNVALPTLDQRRLADGRTPNDPDLVPGTADVAAPDAPGGQPGAGYLWDLALRAGLSLRNYGFYGDLSSYFPGNPKRIPLTRDPFGIGLKVFFATKAPLIDNTDPYFRGFDMNFPDFYRAREWQREFTQADATGTVPALTLLRLPHDHLGDFRTAIDGVDTAETQFADNDYALGLVVETVAKSNVAGSTLIFVLEDDAQNGPDHVDAHRSAGFVIGPYVRRHALVSTHYTTTSMLRTMEEVLGLPAMGLNDGLADPMTDVFDLDQLSWSYRAVVPEILRTTKLPLPSRTASLDGPPACRTMIVRDAAYWARVSEGQNFDVEDHLDVDAFNHALWTGRKGWLSLYPDRDGLDRRSDREALLQRWNRHQRC